MGYCAASSPKKEVVWVIGLSDIGRSPRMQNHALSLATQGNFNVMLIGLAGNKPLSALNENPLVEIHHILEPPTHLSRLPRPIRLPIKAILQALWLLATLIRLPKPVAVLLQVPPAVPTLILCWLICALRRAKLVVDWHNFAYTLMENTSKKDAWLVWLAEKYERFWGRRASRHLCVTKAMQSVLAREWSIEAVCFYDCAPAHFHQASLEEKHELLLRLGSSLGQPLHAHDCCSFQSTELQNQGQAAEQLPEALDSMWAGSPSASPSKISFGFRRSPRQKRPPPSNAPEETTICTMRRQDRLELRSDRPVLLVSSTSWTPDEDFSLLLKAALAYDYKARATSHSEYPRLLILITGKGPQKADFEQQLRAADLRRVAFRTLWLDPEDYPLLLGSCDAGISLHTSSSGLDLPMKIVDMFGCGLPVFAVAFPCLSELVQPGVNGFHFNSAEELAGQLASVFQAFPKAAAPLEKMQENILHSSGAHGSTWELQWEEKVLPVFAGV